MQNIVPFDCSPGQLNIEWRGRSIWLPDENSPWLALRAGGSGRARAGARQERRSLSLSRRGPRGPPRGKGEAGRHGPPLNIARSPPAETPPPGLRKEVPAQGTA